MKLAFLGLGVMGYPMAGHLAKAGHAVTVYNRTAGKAKSWVDAHGGTARETPALAAVAETRGLQALDAPVSGGEAGAVNGKLTIMVGGDPAAFAASEKVMAC